MDGGRVGESVENEVEDEECTGDEEIGVPEAEPGGWHCEVGSGMEGVKWMESLALSEGIIFCFFSLMSGGINLRVVGVLFEKATFGSTRWKDGS